MKNNYPIKYALMYISLPVRFIPGLRVEEYDETFYIASKCYLLDKTESYLIDGGVNVTYKVEFPYKKYHAHPIWDRKEPRFNPVKVDNIFNTYEEASEMAKKQNEEVMNKMLGFIPGGPNREENINKIKEGQKNLFSMCSELEKKIEETTSDLVVGARPNEQSVIVVNNGKAKLGTIPLYHFIEIFREEEFNAFNVSPEEYEKMKTQIQGGNTIDNNVGTYLLGNNLDKGIMEIANGDYQIEKCSFYLKDGNMYYDENMSFSISNQSLNNDSMKVYTLETTKDIIHSFIPNFVSETEVVFDNKTITKKFTLKL